jgi:hypothetical protein
MAVENASRDQNNVPTLIGASSADGTSPVKIYADPSTHRLLVDSTAGVVGPGSSTDNAVARFDGTTGQTIQNSLVIVSDAGLLTAPSLAATNGATGTFTTVDLKTVTVTNGIIISIV